MGSLDPDTIVRSLKGQRILLPDLNALLDGWPRKVNVHLERLRQSVDLWLEEYAFVFDIHDCL